jgi:multiple sugar transport system substrate-binding protein
VFVGAIVGIVLIGLLFAFISRKPNPNSNPVTIKVWGTAPKAAFDALGAQYSGLRPNARIEYSEMDASTYNQTLLDALAAGTGPDVFMIGNQDATKRAPLLLSATSTEISPAQVASVFPSVVTQDFVNGGHVTALPLSIDTLALFYNKDLLDKAGIPVPPKTWQDVLNDIPKLVRQNSQGQLTQAAIALGGPESSVVHAADILSLLMLQNGATMTNEDGSAAFAGSGKASEAFHFYLDFENPSSAAYAWSEGLGNSLDAFAAGKVAMMLGYHRDSAVIQAKNSFLNFAVVPVAQTSGGTNVNYSSYKGLAVGRQSQIGAWGWDFIVFATTNATANQAYLKAANEPPALRANIAAVKSDSEVSPFGTQALSAVSWQVKDYAKMKEIMSNAIQRALRHEATPEDALQAAEDQLNAIR